MREGGVMATYSLDRSLQVEEARLLDGGCKFGSKTSSVGSLVTDHTFASFYNRLEHSFSIPRQNAHKIYHLKLNDVLKIFLGGTNLLLPHS